MTRETKIGLLVGLTFIIIVGLLLSPALNTETDVPQANLPKVTRDLRAGTGNPASRNPPIVAYVPNVHPDQPVPTGEEVRSRPNDSIVRIGVGNSGAPLIISGHADAPTFITSADHPVTPGDPRARIATGDEALIDAEGHPINLIAPHPTSGGDGRVSPPSVPAVKSYEAVVGDTVSKMATRFLGANTKPNRDAIINANPSLKDAPDKIIVGQTYKIPLPPKPAAAIHATDATALVPPPAPAPAPAPVPTPVVEVPAPAHVYIVQPGDNLSRIASDQLGDPNAWAAIKELNKDILHGGDMLVPNMKLRMPSAPVASVRS